MLIDHIGYIFFPDNAVWRMFGRIAFPLYAYAIVLGYGRTRNVRQYMLRLAIIAFLSQLPYEWAFGQGELNAVCTLLVSLGVLWGIDTFKAHKWVQFALPLAALPLLEWGTFDYGAYGLLLVLLYRYTKGMPLVLGHLALNILIIAYKGWYLQLYSIISTLMLVYGGEMLRLLDKIPVPRRVWRSFYPAHLLALAILNALMESI